MKTYYLVVEKRNGTEKLVNRLPEKEARDLCWELCLEGADAVCIKEDSNHGRAWKENRDYQRLLKKTVG